MMDCANIPALQDSLWSATLCGNKHGAANLFRGQDQIGEGEPEQRHQRFAKRIENPDENGF
jgi:hypothetical protein